MPRRILELVAKYGAVIIVAAIGGYMLQYRTYVLGRTGSIISGDDLSAENDQAAIATAWQRLETYNEMGPYEGCGIEVGTAAAVCSAASQRRRSVCTNALQLRQATQQRSRVNSSLSAHRPW